MDHKASHFWEGFFKEAAKVFGSPIMAASPHINAPHGRFSLGGIQRGAKHNPLPTEGMQPIKPVHHYSTGRGVPSMATP